MFRQVAEALCCLALLTCCFEELSNGKEICATTWCSASVEIVLAITHQLSCIDIVLGVRNILCILGNGIYL